MKDKHTPGPWTANPHNDLISDKDGNILAYLRCTKTTSVGNGWLPMEANARLVAAAPELFEALEELYNAYLVMEQPRLYKALAEAKKLIAKIEGD